MTGAAALPAVSDAASAIIVRDARMRPGVARAPIVGVVTLGAVAAKHSGVVRWFAMTTNAGNRRSLETRGWVAAFTRNAGMPSGKPKLGQVMVKGGWIPPASAMA